MRRREGGMKDGGAKGKKGKEHSRKDEGTTSYVAVMSQGFAHHLVAYTNNA